MAIHHQTRFHQGFTLIELSIVLVVIGLLVGGIIVGQALIEAALMRKEISAIQGYVTALNTFKTKYNYLPGDLPRASNFFPVTFGGNGDNAINYTGSGWTQLNTNGGTYEFMAVNTQLAYAGLITGLTYDETLLANGVQRKMIYETPTKSGLCAVSSGSNNFLRLGCSTGAAASTYGSPSGSLGLTVALGINAPRAYAIDNKLDNGMPRTGKILQAFQAGTASDATYWYAGCTTSSGGVYYYQAANDSYDTNSNGTMYGCPLWLYGLY